MTANPERGEVALDLDGEEFVLCAELGRVAAWTAETGIQSLFDLHLRLSTADPKVLFAGARALCISANAEKIGGVMRFAHFPKLQQALTKALLHGLEAPEGNADAPPGAKTPQ